MKDINYFVLDLETGGFDADLHCITEVSFAILNYEFEVITDFTKLVKPYDFTFKQQTLTHTQGALDVTGLTIEMLEDEGEDIKKVLFQFKKALLSAKKGKVKPIICGHNVKFDLKFLKTNFTNILNYDIDEDLGIVLDTLSLCYFFNLEQENYKLESLAKKLNFSQTQAHRSLSDVYTTIDLLKHFKQGNSTKNTTQTTEQPKQQKQAFSFEF
jgi:DNA polymerase III alpha subunit (gram-positive type)